MPIVPRPPIEEPSPGIGRTPLSCEVSVRNMDWPLGGGSPNSTITTVPRGNRLEREDDTAHVLLPVWRLHSGAVGAGGAFDSARTSPPRPCTWRPHARPSQLPRPAGGVGLLPPISVGIGLLPANAPVWQPRPLSPTPLQPQAVSCIRRHQPLPALYCERPGCGSEGEFDGLVCFWLLLHRQDYLERFQRLDT